MRTPRNLAIPAVAFLLAFVVFDPNRTTTATLVKIIEEAGFKARKLTR